MKNFKKLIKEAHLGNPLNEDKLPDGFHSKEDLDQFLKDNPFDSERYKKLSIAQKQDILSYLNRDTEKEFERRMAAKRVNENKFEKESNMPSQEEVDKFFSITQNETHYLNSKPVKGQKGDKVRSEIEPWNEYDLSNYRSLVRKYKEGRPSVSETKKKKKGPKLNKPMRSSSGGKAYKVYVKDPKTGNIKTVRFGSGGLRAKINDRKARQAFAKRHKCSTRNDKTKASYWSCRLPRYAKLLGLKSSFSGFW